MEAREGRGDRDSCCAATAFHMERFRLCSILGPVPFTTQKTPGWDRQMSLRSMMMLRGKRVAPPSRLFLLLLLAPCSWSLHGRTIAHAGANVSSLYRVRVHRANTTTSSLEPWAASRSLAGQPQELTVYENRVDHRLAEAAYIRPNRSVAFTTFDAGGSASESVVEVIASRPFHDCVLRPLSLALACERWNETTVRFRISSSATVQVSVELDAPADYIRHVLLVFANPVGPGGGRLLRSTGSENSTMYFGPGVHYLGGQVPIPGHVRHIHIEEGAFVHGGFITTNDTSSVSITGRGVISGELFPFHSPNFTWSLINMDKGIGHSIDGVILVDPPQFYFRAYAPNVRMRNVKMVSAWTYNTDGVAMGVNGLLERSFIRANDDSIKLFGAGMRVANVVVWQMQNGGVFQTGWWGTVDRANVSVSQVDLIHAEWGAFTGGSASPNDAVFDNCGTATKFYNSSDIAISNVRIESSVVRLFNVVLAPGSVGRFGGYFVANVSFVDGAGITGTGNITGASSGAMVENFVVENVVIGDRCVNSSGALHVFINEETTKGVLLKCP